MKTAMQEIIDYIDHMQNVYIKKSKETKDKNYQKGAEAILTATTLIKIQAKKLLEKEKMQIIDAANQNVFVGNKVLTKGENYYNQTYEKK
jgi:hypothetical protein